MLALITSIHILGDWGRRGQFSQRNVATMMASVPHGAVISVGDNFYPDGIQTSEDKQIRESWTDIYIPTKPWFVALGNHDHHGNVSAQMNIEHEYWNMPAAVYDFTIGEHTFIVADSTTIDGNQFKHIDILLNKVTTPYKWIVAHNPIVTAGWHHDVFVCF